MAKHKHAEVIKAWADGAEIEYCSIYESEWQDAGPSPAWLAGEGVQYRIKPDPRAARDMAIARAVEDAVKKAHVSWTSGISYGMFEYNLASIIASVKD